MKKILTSLVVFLLVIGTPVLAEDAASGDLADKVSAAVESLVLLKKDLSDRYTLYLTSESAATDAEEKLEPVRLTINTLDEQLKALDENIRRTETNVNDLRLELIGSEKELADLFDVTAAREVALKRSRKLLDDFIRMAYKSAQGYTGRGGEISTLKFVLSGETLSSADLTQTYLAILQTKFTELIDDVKSAESYYEESRSQLLVKRGRLIAMRDELDADLVRLEEMRAAKDALLAETKGQESEYLKIIAQAKKDQEETLKDIEDLKSNMSTINEKLTEVQKKVGDEAFREILKNQGVSDPTRAALSVRVPRLIWPADPGRGITAYFHDPEYEAMFGVLHQAIDFRLSQGSPVGSAAPGVVYRTHNAGLGYSYVLVVHPGGLMTAYGHISKILVKEGDLVKAGETIGLSGGSPGTSGAGWMTTGPHLHFEVFNHGEHVDPLDYLPLEMLPSKDVPEKYLSH